MTLHKIHPLYTQLGAARKTKIKLQPTNPTIKKKEEILQEQTSLPSKRQYPTNINVFA